MTALDLLRKLCDPDSKRSFLREPGLGCNLFGTQPAGTATNGRILLSLRSDRFLASEGVPAFFADEDAAKLQRVIDFYQPDAEPLVCDVGRLTLWCGPPHFPTSELCCEWPDDRGGILHGLPIDRVQVANLLHVAYWLCRPLETVEVRRCRAEIVSPTATRTEDILYFAGLSHRAEFLGILMPLNVETAGRSTEGWPVFAGGQQR